MWIRKLAGAVYWGELSYCACTLASLASLGPVWALIGSGARIFSSDNGVKALCSAVLEPAVLQPHLAEQSSHRPGSPAHLRLLFLQLPTFRANDSRDSLDVERDAHSVQLQRSL